MRILRLAVAAVAGTASLAVGCSDGANVVSPTASLRLSQPPASVNAATSARRVETSGHYDAVVDFSTLTLTPRGQNCRLVVRGQLNFTGTIQGTATGETSALVFGPCSEVAVTPPGTFEDVFKSEAVFVGTVDGQPVTANVLYMGGVQPGGAIEGRLIFSNGAAGRLDVFNSVVAVGGAYRGSLVIP